MNEHEVDVTDAITPENPETTAKIKKIAIIATAVAAGTYLIVRGVQTFTERKRVTLTVADQPED